MAEAEDASGDEQPDSADEKTAETPLPDPLHVYAEGPVTANERPSDSVTETWDRTVRIDRTVDTLEDFGNLYDLRNKSNWKRSVIAYLLDREDPDVRYTISSDYLEEWTVTVDGRVEAYNGIVDVLADPESDIGVESGEYVKVADLPRELAQYNYDLVHPPDPCDWDNIGNKLFRDLVGSPLFGPGADLARINREHGVGNDIAPYLDDLVDDLRENDG